MQNIAIETLTQKFPNTYRLIEHYIETFKLTSFAKMPFSCKLALSEAYYLDVLDETMFDIYEVSTVAEVKAAMREIIQINQLDIPHFKAALNQFIEVNLKPIFEHFFEYINTEGLGEADVGTMEYDPIEADQVALARVLNAQII